MVDATLLLATQILFQSINSETSRSNHTNLPSSTVPTCFDLKQAGRSQQAQSTSLAEPTTNPTHQPPNEETRHTPTKPGQPIECPETPILPKRGSDAASRRPPGSFPLSLFPLQVSGKGKEGGRDGRSSSSAGNRGVASSTAALPWKMVRCWGGSSAPGGEPSSVGTGWALPCSPACCTGAPPMTSGTPRPAGSSPAGGWGPWEGWPPRAWTARAGSRGSWAAWLACWRACTSS